MNKLWLLVVASLLLAGNAAAMEGSNKKIAAPTYEYLKPTPDAVNTDFNAVYYQTTVNGVSVITSMTLELDHVVFHYFLKNNVDRQTVVKLDEITVRHGGKDLKLYEGRFIPKDENNPSAGVNLGMKELKGDCSMEMGEYCTGDVYTPLPGDFADGSVVDLQFAVAGKTVAAEFIYEKDWMTGQSYRQLRDEQRQKESK